MSSLSDYLPSCEKLGHLKGRIFRIDKFESGYVANGYCDSCRKPFTRSATSAEIKEYERVMSIPLHPIIPAKS